MDSVSIDRRIVAGYLATARGNISSTDDLQMIVWAEAFFEPDDEAGRHRMASPKSDTGAEKSLEEFAEATGLVKTTQENTQPITAYILRELYLAICEEDERYREEIKSLSSDAKALIAAVAGYTVAAVGIGAATAAALVSVALLLISRIGIGAFCKYVRDNHVRIHIDRSQSKLH